MPIAADLAVKGLLILAAAAAAGFMLRRRAAATRYLVWSTAMMSLLLLPVLAALLPAWQAPVIPEAWIAAVEAPQAPPQPERRPAREAVTRETPRAIRAAPPAVREASEATRETPRAAYVAALARLADAARSTGPRALVLVWMIGALALMAHLLAGVLRVGYLARRGMPSASPHVLDAFERTSKRLGISRTVRLIESGSTTVPVTWELLRPAVMLPATAGDWPADRLEVVLLHELAHVKRRDCQIWLLAHVATALHWFNPLAWYALRRLRIEREHACDDHVLTSGARATDYANHLLEIARGLLRRQPSWAAVPMARRSQLRGRVTAILDPRNPRKLPDRRTTMIATIATLILLLPLAALQAGVSAQVPQPSPAAAKPSVAAVPLASPSPAFAAVPSATPRPTPDAIPSAVPRPTSAAVPSAVPRPTSAAVPSAVPRATAQASTQPSIDELVSMRIHGVTPEFIDSIRTAVGGNLTIDDFIAFRIHGVNAELAASMRGVFGDDIDGDDLVSARIHGVSPELAQRMSDVFGTELSFDMLVSMRIHGASAEYIEQIRGLVPDGDALTAGDIVSMRIHGVSVEWINELRDDGYIDLTADELVSIKIHGIDRILKRRKGGQ